jgi:hypothetical protein
MLGWYRNLKRKMRYWWQRRTRGWDDSVTWSLDAEIARFVAPRLKRFKELNNGHPCDMTAEQWDEIIDKIIWTMEFCGSEESCCNPDTSLYERADEGLKLFGQWFRHLWW